MFNSKNWLLGRLPTRAFCRAIGKLRNGLICRKIDLKVFRKGDLRLLFNAAPAMFLVASRQYKVDLPTGLAIK